MSALQHAAYRRLVSTSARALSGACQHSQALADLLKAADRREAAC